MSGEGQRRERKREADGEDKKEWGRKQGRASSSRGDDRVVNTGRPADRVTSPSGSHSQHMLPY